MEFWIMFYPGTVAAFSIFFARGMRHYQQTRRDADNWKLSSIAAVALAMGVVWPIAMIPLIAMGWIARDEARQQRIENQGLVLSEALRMMNRNPEDFEAAAQDVLAKLRVRREIERHKARQKFHDDWTKTFNELTT
jgi:biopolymer transport protein ExbB/TolQ